MAIDITIHLQDASDGGFDYTIYKGAPDDEPTEVDGGRLEGDDNIPGAFLGIAEHVVDLVRQKKI